jgi:hypothetical protein
MRRLTTILAFLAVFILLLLNAIHHSYPDEFDNIFGGYRILHGVLPWTGFFSHHGAMGYLLAAIIVLFSGQSFVAFRLLAAIFYLGLLALIYHVLKQKFVLVFMLVFALSATYFWGHMFLADSLSGYFLVPAYGSVMLRMFSGKKFSRRDIAWVSIFTAISFLISPTYIYVIASICGITIIYNRQDYLRTLLIFAAPYLLFGLYLIVTRSLADFYFQSVVYNQQYYIYNYPFAPGSTTINPIRYAIVIFNNFIQNFRGVLLQVKDFNFNYPVNLTLALTDTLFWLYLLSKRKYLLALLSFGVIAYATVRGDPLRTGASDYQMAVYIMLSIFQAAFLFTVLWQEIKLRENLLKPLYWGFFLIGGLYWFFTIAFFFSQFWGNNYARYMGTMPTIYDRPKMAAAINAAVGPDRYCWIGPFEFEEMLHLNCKLPSKYDWILPQFARSEKIQKELLAEYAANKADLIVYRRDFAAFGIGNYSGFFTQFLDKNYLRLKEVPGFNNYHFTLTDLGDFHPDQDFNFEKNVATEVAGRLAAKGYILPPGR